MQKTDRPGLYKVQTGILINTDAGALKAYKTRKKRETRLNDLETEVKEIKEMLMLLLNRNQ